MIYRNKCDQNTSPDRNGFNNTFTPKNNFNFSNQPTYRPLDPISSQQPVYRPSPSIDFKYPSHYQVNHPNQANQANQPNQADQTNHASYNNTQYENNKTFNPTK